MAKTLEERKDASHRYYEKNEERINAKKRKYEQEHKEELKAARRRYYEENKDKIDARNRKYAREHREEAKARSRKYYEENKERVKGREKKYAHEHLEESRPGRMAYQRRFRAEHPEYNRDRCQEYYERHRAKEIRRHTEDIRRNLQRFYDFKATLACSRCGQSFPDCPAVIDLHHKGGDPKLSKVTLLAGRGFTSKRFQAELAKCIPLCANCHRILHVSEKQEKEKGLDGLGRGHKQDAMNINSF